MQHYLDGVASYGLAFFMMIYGASDQILAIGGLVLLLVRIVADGPRAIRNVKGWLGYGSKRKPTRRSPRKGGPRNGADTGSGGESTG